MDEEQLQYLLQSSYLPSDTGFQIGQFGPNQNYLGKGMQGLESLGIGPNLNYLGDGTMTGSIGIGPNQNYLGKGMQIGSMGQPRYDSGTQTIFPSNMSPALSDLGGIIPSYGVANEEDVEQVDSLTGEKKSNGILDAIMSVVMPGYNFLKNMGSGKSYQFTDPRGSFKGGIYTMDGVNYPRSTSFGGEFFDRSTGTNRFDRAKDRFRTSRSKKDLFAASRTGAEFANAKKILDFQSQPGNYQTDFMDRPKSERKFTGQAPKGTTAFDTKSGMGRRGFYKGGIASLYG